MNRSVVLFIPLILVVLAGFSLVHFLPDLKSHIIDFLGGVGDESPVTAVSVGRVSKSGEPEFPARMDLQDAKGKTIKVVLLSRSRTQIRFLREGDRSEHVYPISNLDPLSRKEVEAFPVTGIDLGSDGNPSAGGLTRDEIYIEQLRKANQQMKEDILMLQLKAEGLNKYHFKIKNLEAKIKRNEISIAKREQFLLKDSR